MRSRLRRAALFVAALVTAGCEKLPASDVERVTQLQARYASRYEFSTAQNQYLIARARPGITVDSAEAEKIYTDFFMPLGKNAQSTLVYLNLYDERGKFLYQLMYDEANHRIVREQTEAY